MLTNSFPTSLIFAFAFSGSCKLPSGSSGLETTGLSISPSSGLSGLLSSPHPAIRLALAIAMQIMASFHVFFITA